MGRMANEEGTAISLHSFISTESVRCYGNNTRDRGTSEVMRDGKILGLDSVNTVLTAPEDIPHPAKGKMYETINPGSQQICYRGIE